MQIRVLIAYGSKMGGTEGLADMLAAELVAQGIPTDVRAADSVDTLVGYDAVIVGGALYVGRWHRAARRFVKRRRTQPPHRHGPRLGERAPLPPLPRPARDRPRPRRSRPPRGATMNRKQPRIGSARPHVAMASPPPDRYPTARGPSRN